MTDKNKPYKLWQAHLITAQADIFTSPFAASLAGRARGRAWDYTTYNLYDYAAGSSAHKKIDDTPYGGGAGMVLRPDVAASALDDVINKTNNKLPLLMPSPRGKVFDQARAAELAAGAGAIFLCARFEGVDERLASVYELEEISLGDYILSGGEQAALIIVDAAVRLLDGVMGESYSAVEESFAPNGPLIGAGALLEYPHYTKPETWVHKQKEISVPAILRSGDHNKIAAWRQQQAELATKTRRPDLWERYKGK